MFENSGTAVRKATSSDVTQYRLIFTPTSHGHVNQCLPDHGIPYGCPEKIIMALIEIDDTGVSISYLDMHSQMPDPMINIHKDILIRFLFELQVVMITETSKFKHRLDDMNYQLMRLGEFGNMPLESFSICLLPVEYASIRKEQYGLTETAIPNFVLLQLIVAGYASAHLHEVMGCITAEDIKRITLFSILVMGS